MCPSGKRQLPDAPRCHHASVRLPNHIEKPDQLIVDHKHYSDIHRHTSQAWNGLLVKSIKRRTFSRQKKLTSTMLPCRVALCEDQDRSDLTEKTRTDQILLRRPGQIRSYWQQTDVRATSVLMILRRGSMASYSWWSPLQMTLPRCNTPRHSSRCYKTS